MKKVEVEWIDAQSSMDVMTIDELKRAKPAITYSCGYLVHQDKKRIVLAFMMFGVNREGDELMKHYQIIPKNMIIKIKVLK